MKLIPFVNVQLFFQFGRFFFIQLSINNFWLIGHNRWEPLMYVVKLESIKMNWMTLMKIECLKISSIWGNVKIIFEKTVYYDIRAFILSSTQLKYDKFNFFLIFLDYVIFKVDLFQKIWKNSGDSRSEDQN